MYEYDKNPSYWNNYEPPTCNGGTWESGTKITLNEPVGKKPGTPNVAFSSEAYISNKKPCPDCTCASGCPMTLTISNDGKKFSGSGVGGTVWQGSGAKFSAKASVPIVDYIYFPDSENKELPGKRDSTRMYVPAIGGTKFIVVGRGFQDSPHLRCKFTQLRVQSEAEFISDTMIACKTEQFIARPGDAPLTTTADNTCHSASSVQFSQTVEIGSRRDGQRLFDSECTDSMYTGAAVLKIDGSENTWSYTEIEVCNDYLRCSEKNPKRDDGAYKYLEEEGSLHRSTCESRPYPTTDYGSDMVGDMQAPVEDSEVPAGWEKNDPCYQSHRSEAADPAFAQGNGIQLKFGTCFEAQTAKSKGKYWGDAKIEKNADYYGTDREQNVAITAAQPLVQTFRIPAEMQGTLTAVDLHLVKPKPAAPVAQCDSTDTCESTDRRATVLEVCISAGGPAGGYKRFDAYGQGTRSDPGVNTSRPGPVPTAVAWNGDTAGHILACETITIQSINRTDGVFTTYFKKNPYLLSAYTLPEGGDCTSTTCATYYQVSAGTGKDGAYETGGAHATNKKVTDSLYYNSQTAEYYLTISHVSGPQTVEWATSIQTSHSHPTNMYGATFNWQTNMTASLPMDGADYVGFRAKFYTCEGCRWTYISNVNSGTAQQIGKIYDRQDQSETYLSTYQAASNSNRCKSGSNLPRPAPWDPQNPQTNQLADPTGQAGYECGQSTFREMLAQAVRPTEDITVGKLKARLQSAYSPDSATHAQRSTSGDFISASGSEVSVVITKYGKLDEYVCHTFTGGTQTRDDGGGWQAHGYDLLGCGSGNKLCKHCDVNSDGLYNELCFTGAKCNSSETALWGGCGPAGICARAEIVSGSHTLRNHPAGDGPTISKCGDDELCEDLAQSLKPANSVTMDQAISTDDWKDVVFEFQTPPVLDKHTTYYVNMFIDESIISADSVMWAGGQPTSADPIFDTDRDSRKQMFGAYKRRNLVNTETDLMTFVWTKIPDFVFDLELFRCVTSLPRIDSFSTIGSAPGSCEARSSPRGGSEGATITFKGKNFFPSENLVCNFHDADGNMAVTVNCEATSADYTEAKCPAPAFNPYSPYDCTVPGQCQGVEVSCSNDGYNFGYEKYQVKYNAPYNNCNAQYSVTGTCASATPSASNASNADLDTYVQRMGFSTRMMCFQDIYVSVSGSDRHGDGSEARPFATIQAALDACNEIDTIIIFPGIYTGSGNRGLRHNGKKIYIVAYDSAQETTIDCEHVADGFVLNNNKDSKTPSAGFVDMSGVKTQNCENLRVYH